MTEKVCTTVVGNIVIRFKMRYGNAAVFLCQCVQSNPLLSSKATVDGPMLDVFRR